MSRKCKKEEKRVFRVKNLALQVFGWNESGLAGRRSEINVNGRRMDLIGHQPGSAVIVRGK